MFPSEYVEFIDMGNKLATEVVRQIHLASVFDVEHQRGQLVRVNYEDYFQFEIYFPRLNLLCTDFRSPMKTYEITYTLITRKVPHSHILLSKSDELRTRIAADIAQSILAEYMKFYRQYRREYHLEIQDGQTRLTLNL